MTHPYRPELIARAKTLLAREANLNWEWGDLLTEAAPPGQQTDAVLVGFLEEVGWYETGRELSTAKRLRATAIAWPVRHREPKASFTAHAELAEAPDRFKLMRPGLTKRDARALAGRRPLKDDHNRPAGRLVDILSDPAVRAEIADDPNLAAAVRRASIDVSAREAEKADGDQRERVPGLRSADDAVRIVGRLARARREVARAVSEAMEADLSAAYRQHATEEAEAVQQAAEWALAYFGRGDRSFEEQLADMLSKEG